MRTIASASADLKGINYLTRIETGGHRLIADEPSAAGGANAGPAPYDYLLASLAACTLMTLRMYAERKGWDIGTLELQLSLSKDAEKHTHIHRSLSTGVALTDEQQQKLLEIAGKTPVTLTLLQGAAITTDIQGEPT